MIAEQRLTSTFRECFRICDRMRADGATAPDIARYLEGVLRSTFSDGRPWHYYCDPCQDTGWIMRDCTQRHPCGRPFTLPKQRSDDYTGRGACHGAHRYAVPCASCEKGNQKRRALERTPRIEDEVTAASKTSKPTRFGR